MSNSKGIYAGVVIRCEVEKIAKTTSFKRCPEHGNRGGNGKYCSVCGQKTEYETYMQYPLGWELLDEENERLYILPNQSEWENGVIYFPSNIRGNTYINTDFTDRATTITLGIISQQILKFMAVHTAEIAQLSAKCKRCEVVWAVVPWWEF